MLKGWDISYLLLLAEEWVAEWPQGQRPMFFPRPESLPLEWREAKEASSMAVLGERVSELLRRRDWCRAQVGSCLQFKAPKQSFNPYAHLKVSLLPHGDTSRAKKKVISSKKCLTNYDERVKKV